MASMLYCPECGEIIGKDTECSILESCGTCGEDNIYNERGDDDDLTDEEQAYVRKKRRGARTGSITTRYRF